MEKHSIEKKVRDGTFLRENAGIVKHESALKYYFKSFNGYFNQML